MVQDPKTRRGIDEAELKTRYPHTWQYLKRFEPILRKRAAFKRYFTRKDKGGKVIETGPFYSMFDVGDYTFAPWRVVWLGFGAKTMKVAVVGTVDGKAVMTNQAMHPFVPLEEEDEAYYVCASMNSSPFELAVRAHTQEGGKSFAQSNILEHIRITKYDPADPVHQALAEASQEAHEAAARGDEARLREIEERVDALAGELWGLTTAELAEICRSLKELGSRGDQE